MIKIISELKEKHGTETLNKAYKRLSNHPEAGSFLCRYTFKELKQHAAFLSRWGMNFTLAQYDTFRQRFNAFEMGILEQLSKTTIDERIKGIERAVKTATERTSRYLRDYLMDMQSERDIQKQIEATQSKRSRPQSEMNDEWLKLQSTFS